MVERRADEGACVRRCIQDSWIQRCSSTIQRQALARRRLAEPRYDSFVQRNWSASYLSLSLLSRPLLTSFERYYQEPPFFLGASVALALRQALLSSRQDGGFSKEAQLVPFRFPMTSERLRNESGDWLAKKGRVEPKEGEEGKEFFVRLS